MNKKSKKLLSSEKHALLVQGNLDAIKNYFFKIRELMVSGDPYPVDLDEVWPLVYASKQKATDSLKNKFVETVDYITQKPDFQRFNRTVETKVGGDFKTVKYKLTVFALEWFVARQSQEIFKIYREVFHMFSQALTPIAGVMPIFYKGCVWYNYKEICQSLGFYPNWHRKERYPSHFQVINRALFVTAAYCSILEKKAHIRKLEKEADAMMLDMFDDITQG